MSPDLFASIAVGALLLALSSLLLPGSVSWRGIAAVACMAVACGAITVGWFVRKLPVPESEVELRPVQQPTNGYVGAAACRSCHPHEHATWHDS